MCIYANIYIYVYAYAYVYIYIYTYSHCKLSGTDGKLLFSMCSGLEDWRAGRLAGGGSWEGLKHSEHGTSELGQHFKH